MTTIKPAGWLQVGDMCVPEIELVGLYSRRKPLPCRVESVGRTAVQLKEMFGKEFYVDKDQPCRLLSSK